MEQFKGAASPAYIYIYKDSGERVMICKHNIGLHTDSYAFGYFWLVNKISDEEVSERSFQVSEKDGMHEDIENELIGAWAENNYYDEKSAKSIVRCNYIYRGRLWINEKIITFYESNEGYPDKGIMRQIISKLNDEGDFVIDGSWDLWLQDDDWHYVNKYSINEYVYGIKDGEENINIDKKRNDNDIQSNKRLGLHKLNQAMVNDPHLDDRYKRFLEEKKKRRNI